MDYSQKMQLAETMWMELRPIFKLAMDAEKRLSIKFDAYHEVHINGPYKDAITDAIHVAEQKETARMGEPALWDLRTIHYLKKHIVSFGGIEAVHNVDTDTAVSVDWSEHYIFTVG